MEIDYGIITIVGGMSTVIFRPAMNPRLSRRLEQHEPRLITHNMHSSNGNHETHAGDGRADEEQRFSIQKK